MATGYIIFEFCPEVQIRVGGKKGANQASLNRADISKYTRVENI